MNDKAREYLELWRNHVEATEEIQLSIGPAVIRSNLSLLDLVAAGHIPTPLLADLQELFEAGEDREKQKEVLGKLPQVTPVMDTVCIAAIVAPIVGREESDDVFPVSRIPISDKIMLMARLSREAEPLREFHEEQGRANGTPCAGDDVPPSAVGDSGDS